MFSVKLVHVATHVPLADSYVHVFTRYTSNGSLLYSVGEDGILRRYRRYPDHHEYLGPVYQHRLDVQDLDISPYDECILCFCSVSLGEKLFNFNNSIEGNQMKLQNEGLSTMNAHQM